MFDETKVLVTGGSGLLGNALKKIFPKALYPSRTEFDVTNYDQMENYLQHKNINLIFHGGAFTSPPKIDNDPLKAIEVNVIGTSNMVKLAMKNDCKLIYVSTDYVFRGDKGNYKEEDSVYPVNKYAWSKLAGECAVRLYDKSLIIRTSFGPDIFPYEKAFCDQWTSRESVTNTALMISELIRKDYTGVIHVGGKRKSVYEYAVNLDKSSTPKEIGKLSVCDVNFNVPIDTSLNTKLYQRLVKKKNNLL